MLRFSVREASPMGLVDGIRIKVFVTHATSAELGFVCDERSFRALVGLAHLYWLLCVSCKLFPVTQPGEAGTIKALMEVTRDAPVGGSGEAVDR